MTPEQINAVLRQMEHVRELSYEAESRAEERRLVAEYEQLYRSIKPFIDAPSPTGGGHG